MTIDLPTCECLRCGHQWVPRKPEVPIACPGCSSPYWRRERTQTQKKKALTKKRKKR